MKIALAHDYLTQRGGAERVLLALTRAFPDAPVYTSLFDPAGTFPQFGKLDIRTTPLDNIPLLRTHHRLAFPLLAPAFTRLRVDADVVICSSSGWAHGVQTSGRKIVYCHAPARWLYQSDRYLGRECPAAARLALSALRRPLVRWDQRAASTADTYIANSTVTRHRVLSTYGIEAVVVHPPAGVTIAGPTDPATIAPGFVLCVSRLLPYKNVGAIVDAFRGLPAFRLVVVGDGPLSRQLERAAPTNVDFVGEVSDARLRWLYAASAGVVAASYEDLGLTPIEGAVYGKPTVALRDGGFLDTVVEGSTGVFFDVPEPDAIAHAVVRLLATTWNADRIRAHASRFDEERFARQLIAIAEEGR